MSASASSFTTFQKLLIVALLLGAAGGVRYLAQGKASTTVGLTLRTNPTLEDGY